MAVNVDSTPAMTQTSRDVLRTEIPASRAASGFDEAARMVRPSSVRVNSSCSPMTASGATTRVSTWAEVRPTLPMVQPCANGTG